MLKFNNLHTNLDADPRMHSIYSASSHQVLLEFELKRRVFLVIHFGLTKQL